MIRVLHVDDDRHDLLLISAQLSKLIDGLEIVPVETASEALERTEREKYDCILSDFRMSDSTGLDLLRSLRERGDNTPFVFLTGQGNEQVAAEALRAGANDYFFKDASHSLYQRLAKHLLDHAERAEQRRLRAEAEAALQASEELYRSTLTNVTDAILLTDEEGKLVFASGNTAGLFALPPEDVLDLGNVVNVLDLPGDLLDSIGGQQETLKFECEVKGESGEIRTLLIHARNVNFRDARILFACRDISERKRALEAIKSERQFLLNILDGFPTATFVIDTNHNLVSWNRACEKLTGLKREDVLGKRVDPRAFYAGCDENRPVLADVVLEQDFELLERFYGDRALMQSRIVPDGYELEAKLMSLGKEYTAYFLAAPLRDTAGRVMGAIETIQDISKRVEAENELRLSEEKYRLVVENANDAIFVLQDQMIVFSNSRSLELTEMSWEQLTGAPAIELVHPDDRKEVEKRARIVQDMEQPLSGLEFRFEMGGRIKWASANLVSVTWDGRPAILVFAADITKHKRAEQEAQAHQRQLMQASKMVALGTLISGVAHEINNPNNFIMLNTPILYEAWESTLPILERYYEDNGDFQLGGLPYTEMRDTIPHLFTGVNEGSKRIKAIVQNLRDFARQDTSDLSQRVNINIVLESAVNLLANQIKKATRKFEVSYGENLPRVRGNRYRLEQVVMNLILNACQALPDSDSGIFVSSSFDSECNCVVIKVRDEGSGISEETIQYIQDPFFTTKRDSGGTGLGLSISTGIIDDHGGDLEFISIPEEGTTAIVKLPPISKIPIAQEVRE